MPGDVTGVAERLRHCGLAGPQPVAPGGGAHPVGGAARQHGCWRGRADRGRDFRSADGETCQSVARAMMPTRTHWIRGTAAGNGILASFAPEFHGNRRPLETVRVATKSER